MLSVIMLSVIMLSVVAPLPPPALNLNEVFKEVFRGPAPDLQVEDFQDQGFEPEP